MAKNRKIRIGDLSIEEPQEIPLSREAICTALRKRDLAFKFDLSGRYLEAKLTHRGAVPISESEPSHVVPFVNVSDWRFWLGMQLKFSIAAGEGRFQSVSLMVLRSALVADERVKILRAEWERFDDPKHQIHAQPHWHVYTSAIENGLPSATGRTIQKFHLAMATGWHLGEANSHYREPSPEGIAGWIQSCVIYTQGQLTTIAKKA